MTDSIPDAASILTPENLGADPRVTPRVENGVQPADQPASVTPSEPASDLDGFQVRFDPARHERRLVRVPGGQRWALKRGNGARIAAGKPIAGLKPRQPSNFPPNPTVPPQLVQPPAMPAPVAPAAPVPSMSIVAPDAPVAGVQPDAPAAPAPLTEAECLIAAKAVTNGALAGAKMWRGPHWSADTMEHGELVGSLARVWMHYGFPKVGPLIEWGLVVITFCMSAEQRRKDLAALWAWLIGKKKPATPAVEDQEAA